jgi:hypothetical protein
MDLSKASIGIKMKGSKRIPIPNARCFQNLFVRSKIVTIMSIPNTGGNNNHRSRAPGLPATFNIR